jgi:hypothetical protein
MAGKWATVSALPRVLGLKLGAKSGGSKIIIIIIILIVLSEQVLI